MARARRRLLLRRRRRRARRWIGEAVDDGLVRASPPAADGREYTIVKILYEPEDLGSRLAALGWQADIRTTGEEFFYGVARR